MQCAPGNVCIGPELQDGPECADEDNVDEEELPEQEEYTTKIWRGWRCSYIRPQEGAMSRRRLHLQGQFNARPPAAIHLPESTMERPAEIVRAAVLASEAKKKIRNQRQNAWEKVQRTAVRARLGAPP